MVLVAFPRWPMIPHAVFFMYPFVICVSFRVKHPFLLFDHFLIGLFVFTLLSFGNSLNIPDTRPLSRICFVDTSNGGCGLFLLSEQGFSKAQKL